MSNKTKRHHYIPRVYLAGFTPSGTRDDRLWVYDIEKDEWRHQTTEQVANKRYFNKIEVAGTCPNYYETEFSKLEGAAAPVIRRISDTLELPVVATQDYENLINFIALLIARTQKFRDISEYFKLEYSQLKGLGPDNVDQLRRLGAHKIIGPNWHMANMIKAYHGFIDQLAHKRWIVMTPEDEDAQFITSDHPFSKLFSSLLFPLSKKVALVAYNGDTNQVWELNKGKVADVNSRTILSARRCVFSSTKELSFIYQEKITGSDSIGVFHERFGGDWGIDLPPPLFAPRTEDGKGEFEI